MIWLWHFIQVWLRMLALMALYRGPLTCERVYDMSPDSTLPASKTYEEWYGSPAYFCKDWKHPELKEKYFCVGSNC